jgi:hypothetical protein
MIPPICYAKLINIAATRIDDLCTLLVLTVKRRFLLILGDSLRCYGTSAGSPLWNRKLRVRL